jgi:Uma2 family endonuclease
MDTVLDRLWTTESFLAWEDRQEGKYEFNGRGIVPITGGSYAHQRIVINLWLALTSLLGDQPPRVAQEMRLRIGIQIRYPDVLISAAPLDQTTRTLTDAVAIFEVLSADTATTDRVEKTIDYAAVPSLRTYVLLERTTIGATVLHREPGGAWTASALTAGTIAFAGPGHRRAARGPLSRADVRLSRLQPRPPQYRLCLLRCQKPGEIGGRIRLFRRGRYTGREHGDRLNFGGQTTHDLDPRHDH